MKLIPCFLLLLYTTTNAQFKPLSIGDKVPDIRFTLLNNHNPILGLAEGQTPNPKHPNLHSFKGKLVILDFWATWCPNCIKKFPLLDSMQQLYPGKLQVILVSSKTTGDSKEKIISYLGKNVNAAGKRYPLIVAFNDTVAARYFPHRYIPYYVWIGPGGNLMAVTGSEELTAENISLALQGGQPPVSGLALMENFEFDKPLFIEGNAGDGSGIMARSTLSRFIPGMGPVARYSRNEQKLTTQYKLINQPLLELIKKAYSTDVRNDRIVFDLPDSIKNCLLPATAAAKRANTYTYELICPPIPHKEAATLVQQDMQRYFSLQAKWEELPAPCYELTIDTVKLKPYLSKGGKNSNKLYDPGNKYLQNGSLSSLCKYLNHTMGRYVICKEQSQYMLDIQLPAGNDEALLQALAGIGIILTPATATVSQFIIYQSPKQKL